MVIADSQLANDVALNDGAPLRVAIVEDSPLVVTLLEEAIAQCGNVVVTATASSQAEAHVVLRACRWDLLILDVQLKDGNGLNVLRTLQAEGLVASRLVAVITTFASKPCEQRSHDLGADYFFDKAFELPTLLALIQKLSGSTRGHAPAGVESSRSA